MPPTPGRCPRGHLRRVPSRAGIDARRIPIEGTLETTFRCNLNCVHCYVNEPAGSKEIAGRWQSNDVCRRCNLMSLCGSCPGAAEMQTGDPESIIPGFCELTHLRAWAALGERSGHRRDATCCLGEGRLAARPDDNPSGTRGGTSLRLGRGLAGSPPRGDAQGAAQPRTASPGRRIQALECSVNPIRG